MSAYKIVIQTRNPNITVRSINIFESNAMRFWPLETPCKSIHPLLE